jgi:hypothetical protein
MTMNLFSKSVSKSIIKNCFAFSLIFLLLFSTNISLFAQTRISGANNKTNKKLSKSEKKKEERERKRLLELEKSNKKNAVVYPDGERTGEKIIVKSGGERTVSDMMTEQSLRANEKTGRELAKEKGIRRVEQEVDRSNLPQNPDAPNVSKYPYSEGDEDALNLAPSAPQTIGQNFDTVTGPTETGAFPPDTMGAVGPTQFIVTLNGRFRSFSKSTGAADGVLNVDSDVFFASVLTPTAINFTSDPNIRYDRLSGRWFINMIDVPNGTGATENRIMIAVSDGPNITGGTVWTFYQFTSPTGQFADYPSFGIDASALYVGANMFSTTTGGFTRTDGWVIPKAPAVAGTTLTVWAFPSLATGSSAGPFAPRGVDNVDPTNTGPTAVGYFIGVDTLAFSLLQIRRVTDPGNTTTSPTISANIPLTVLTTNSSTTVTHLGNTGGTNGNLDALDDRLYAAVLRNGRLWTSHNIRTGTAGTASTTQARHAIRWYEIQNLDTTPTLFQSGTVFDNAATTATARQYWIPSVTVSGQGHAAIGASTAGTPNRIDAFTTGRLVGDTLGTMRNSPGSIAGYTTSTTAYNPPGDSGPGRRWGDYSFTSLDPLDDMTIWTIQEYCSGTNVYNTRVAQLIAPPPASIADGPDAGGLYNVPSGLTSTTVTINGTSVSGSGFYDPGPDLGGGAVNFNHITATVSGANVTVNSVTFNSPTSITLDLNTVGASFSNPNLSPDTVRDLTITNPDGQQVMRNAIINIVVPTAAGANITGKVVKPNGSPVIGATVALSGGFSSETYSSVTRNDGSYFFQDIPVGNDVVITPSKAGYTFSPSSGVFNLVEDLSDADFTGTPDAAHSRTAINDFDGDGISDYAVFRPNQKVWYILQSSTSTMRAEQFGLEADIPVAADYDGDGKTDIAMWRPSTGVWYSQQSSDQTPVSRSFGIQGDLPVYGYFDNDNKVDLAIYRPNTGEWWIQDSSTGLSRTVKFGLATDRPVPQDYDGDGLTDIAVYRPSNGTWYIIKSSDGSYLFRQFGLNGDLPVLGDFDGDGRADLTVFRPGNKVWYQVESLSSNNKALEFGLSDDLVIAGDYDGDSRSDIAVFRESNSNWYVNKSLDNSFTNTRWGMTADIPIIPPSMR